MNGLEKGRVVTETQHKVEKMYGVMHSFTLEVEGFSIAEKAVSPSMDLFRELKSLPQGTVVGIEDFDPREIRKLTRKINGRKFGMSKSDRKYWQEIKSLCNDFGLEVAYLDDFQTYRKYVSKLFEQRDYSHQAVGCYEKLDLEAFENNIFTRDGALSEVRNYNELGYKAGVESEKIFIIEREEKIAERIAKYRPQRVIVGMGHGDYWMVNDSALAANGITVDEYECEFAEQKGRYQGVDIVLVPIWGPDPVAALERELLNRKYNSVTLGRILNEKTPDYIGTWSELCRPEGLFEMYVGERTSKDLFSGIIEDKLGTADFEGRVRDDMIEFEKRYRPDQSSEDSIKDSIYYKGLLKDGKYQGMFTTVPAFIGLGRKFTLNPGAVLL